MIETIVKRTIDPKWKFTQSGVAALYLQDGLRQLPSLFGISDIDDGRVVDYVVYQLYRCRSFLKDGTWQYTWLFSKSAMDKFRKQFLSADGKSGMNYYINQWLDEAELSREMLTSMIAKQKLNPLRKLVYLASEEPIKKRFLNTKDGLALCQSSTTGWSPLSETCGRCDNWEECGKMTATKYPELMRFRKEEYGRKENDNVLTSEFLAELYNCAITNNQICSVVSRYMEDTFLPDQQYQILNSALKSYFAEYKTAPQYGIITQRLASSRAVSELLEEIREVATSVDTEGIRDQFEEYLKLVQFKKIFKEVSKKYEDGARIDAMISFTNEAKKLQQFTLKPEEFIDIAQTYEERLKENKIRHDNPTEKPVNSFYIDGLDEMNKGSNLRTQLSVFMAMSGVGKSHIARWIGFCGAYTSGLDVLHFQLEGSSSETTDAYSAMLSGVSTYEYENGKINTHTLEHLKNTLDTYKGTLKVKSYPKFGKEISTLDLRNECDKYREKFGKYPDIVIVDSLDLITDSSGKNWDVKGLRHKRIATAQDLKDVAGELNCWVVATYQATIENPDWVNDEKNVLTAFNTSECKGLQRPCTHFISLNQSKKEYRESTMRIYADKFRFCKKGEPFRIAVDYEHERFYSRERTLNLPQE